MHTALYYENITFKYALSRNCNVLIDENKHK